MALFELGAIGRFTLPATYIQWGDSFFRKICILCAYSKLQKTQEGG